MALGILATKQGMTQIFTEEGVCVPVTILKIEDNMIMGKRTVEQNGYTALQVGYAAKREKRLNKPDAGQFKKAGIDAKRVVREFRCEEKDLEGLELGTPLSIQVLNDVKSVDVSGTSKGKGFAGVMKRHNFKGFRATHGTHEYFRHGGSIGCRSEPGKVHKGKKMAGQMGNERVTTLNVAVVEIRPDDGLVFLRGAVPGGKGAVVELRASTRTAKRGRGISAEAQARSKNPMKASKAGGR